MNCVLGRFTVGYAHTRPTAQPSQPLLWDDIWCFAVALNSPRWQGCRDGHGCTYSVLHDVYPWIHSCAGLGHGCGSQPHGTIRRTRSSERCSNAKCWIGGGMANRNKLTMRDSTTYPGIGIYTRFDSVAHSRLSQTERDVAGSRRWQRTVS